MTTFVQGHGPGAHQLPSVLGQTVSAASLSVVIASDYTLAVTLSTTAASPMWAELTDGASGYVGAKTGQFPASLGQTTMAGSLSVTLASNQANVPVSVQNASLAVTQSGTWTVQPGNTANSTPWLVTNSSDGPVTAGAVASKSSLVGVQFSSALPTLTTGQQAAIQADSSGRILIGSIASALPAGSNAIGGVTQSGTWSVTGLPASIGQKLSAASTSVVVASDSTIAAVQSGTWTVTSTQLPGTLGQKTMANSMGVVIASDQSTINVSIQNATLAVTQSGTWSSRLNDGAGTSVTVGQKAMASSLPITIASDQSAVPVSGTFWQATQPVSIAATVTTTQTGIDYNTGLAGATTQRVAAAGRAKAWLARNDYTSTPVTTGTYVQLVASTGAATTRLRIFDSSGSAMILATGAAASEVDQLYIPPGGWDGAIELNIASGTRISLKALDATANAGQIVITALS